MKQPRLTTALAYLLVTLAGIVFSTSVSANAASDCHQEATDYGIADEQLDDYITGCLASRGELYAEETPDMEYAPADEAVEMDDAPPDEVVEGEEMQESSTQDSDVTY